MGNCLGSEIKVDDEAHNNPTIIFVNPTTSSRLFTPGTSNGHNSNWVGMSISGSSSDQSQVSNTASGVAVLNGEILPTPNLKKYSYAELKSATRGFKPDSILGDGGFGTVYRGWVDERTLAPSKLVSGMMVAIKKRSKESVQGFKEWQSEVNFLGRLSHPNLVRLLGYCWDDKELLLVYEFVPKGSLDNHLFRRNVAIEPLSWDVRLKIAIGAARGLAFLHSSEKAIIYRDIKASNILLDGNYNAKISDFGLAKLGPSGVESHVSTRVLGTFGYAAPEYVATGHLYVKSDVYGFGIVLLEILAGVSVTDMSRASGQQNFLEWKKEQLSNKKKLKSIMDARLEGQYSSEGAHFAALLTLRCLESQPKNRPSMREVVAVLEQIRALKEKPRQSQRGSPHSSSNRDGRSVSISEAITRLELKDDSTN